MFARVSVVFLLVEFAAYAFFGAVLLGIEGWGNLIGFCLLLGLVARLALTLFTFAVTSAYAGERPHPRLSATALALVVTRELLASIAAFCVFQPLERWLRPRRGPVTDTAHDEPPVLLIHGYSCNAGFWYPMVRALRKRGLTRLYTLNLEPVLGSVDGFAEQVAERVLEIRSQTVIDGLVIVGHSMGGLVGRAYLARHDPEGRVAKLVTLGSPNHGTVMAEFSATRNGRQMRIGSRWLDALVADERDRLHPAKLTAILSYDDNLIAPRDSGCLPGAKDLHVIGVAHVEMVFSKRIQDLVYAEIQS